MNRSVKIFLSVFLATSSTVAYAQSPQLGPVYSYSDKSRTFVLEIDSEQENEFGINTYDLIVKDTNSISVKAFTANNQVIGSLTFSIEDDYFEIKARTERAIWKTEFGIRASSEVAEHFLKKKWRKRKAKDQNVFSVTTRFIPDDNLDWGNRLLDQVYRLNGKMVIMDPVENTRKSISEDIQLNRLLKEQQARFSGTHEEKFARFIIADSSLRKHLPPVLAKVVSLFDSSNYDFMKQSPEVFLDQYHSNSMSKDLIEDAGCVGACGVSAVCAYTGCGAALACAGCAAAGTSCLVCVGNYMSSLLNSGGSGGSGGGGDDSPTEEIRSGWTCYRVGSDKVICEQNE